MTIRLDQPICLACAIFLLLCMCPRLAFANDRAAIDAVFSNYTKLNGDLLSSVATGVGNSGKSYSQLLVEVESYAEREYFVALKKAETLLCDTADRQLLQRLFAVVSATANSASEVPAWTLGRIFICRTDLFVKEFGLLSQEHKVALYRTLQFGFENVSGEEQMTRAGAAELKLKLEQMDPSKTKVHTTKP